jgi:hypothetical protein
MPFRPQYAAAFAVLALLAAPARALGQGGAIDPACENTAIVGPSLEGGTACQRAIDEFAYATQQYAILLSAGNIEPGYASAVGGFPHFRAALHVTGMSMSAPAFKTTQIPVGPATPADLNTQPTDFVTVALDGTLGLFKGFNAGFARMGALDAWVSLNLVPGATASGYSVSPSSSFYLGWGGRLGLVQEGESMPGIGVSYLERDMPKSTVEATDIFGNSVGVTELGIDTHAWSATIGKHFGSVDLVLGAGQTTFSSSANLTWSSSGQSPPAPLAVTGTSVQTQFFGDFGLNLGGFDIVLEIGQVQGSTLKTFNTFNPQAGSERSFASVAISFGL